MKMFLTRLGENSRMAVTGDLSQVDLPQGQLSGLRDASRALANIDRIAFVQFTDRDVVRHSLVTRIIQAYDARAASSDGEVDLFAVEDARNDGA
jgi:phosphate starvation-inducible PhoH-like protein